MAAAVYPLPRHFTPEEYLLLEREAEYKSEYLEGVIYAMAGSNPEHSTIMVNLTGEVRAQLRGKPCRAFSNDMKVRSRPDGLYAYPDLSVVCGEPKFHDARRDVLINPVVIFEVLSPSTESYDRGQKFEQYRQIESLKDYVLIAQEEPRIEHYSRQPDNEWLLTTARGLDNSVHIASIDCTLLLAEIYDNVTFTERSQGA